MFEPRYGIWAPVGGNFGPLGTPEEPINASYERSRYPDQSTRGIEKWCRLHWRHYRYVQIFLEIVYLNCGLRPARAW
jgi:hypothetical protein